MLKSIPSIVNTIKESVTTITASAAFNERKTNNGIVIDVREPAEIIESVVPGAVNIPRGVLEMKILQLYTDAAQPLYIHCASGVRALFAAEQLQRLGYENVKAISCTIPDIQKAFI